MSGLATGLATGFAALAAAVAAVVLLQKFGRGAETDGLLAAYGAYLVLAIAASGSRLVLVTDLTRARGQGRLDQALRGYTLALTAVAIPAITLTVLLADEIARLIVVSGQARHIAAGALSWFVIAGFVQLYAALAASALAALDDYLTAAYAYGAGAFVTLGVFVALMDGHGPVALAWGSAAGGAAVLAPLMLALARRGSLRLGPSKGIAVKLGKIAWGATLPLSLQFLYLISIRAASGLGKGEATTLAVAYLFASALVAATASSLALISSAPLTRRSTDAGEAAAHVVHSAWLSLSVVAAGAAVAVVGGEPVFSRLFGGTFSGQTGRELGLLIVYLVPWMVASVAIALAFPLLFVLERPRVLIPLALAAPFLQLLAAHALRAAFGLGGVVAALDLTTLATLLVLAGALSLNALAVVSRGLVLATLALGSAAAFAFVPAALLLPRLPAAAIGLGLYALVLVTARPRGLRAAWAYVRALHG